MLWFHYFLILLLNFGIIQKHYKDVKSKTERKCFLYVFNYSFKYPFKFLLMFRLFFWFVIPVLVLAFFSTVVIKLWGAYYWFMPTKDLGFFYKHAMLEMETLGLWSHKLYSIPVPADMGKHLAGLWAALKQLYAFSLISSLLIVVFFQKWHKTMLNQAQR
jgi:hypothetical protein